MRQKKPEETTKNIGVVTLQIGVGIKCGLFKQESDLADRQATIPTLHNSSIQKNVISFFCITCGHFASTESDLPEMTTEWLRQAYFSDRLQPVELGYGPITAPCVRATGAVSHLCLVSGASSEKAVTGSHPTRAVSQDQSKTTYYYSFKTCPSLWGSADNHLWDAAVEINRGHCHTPFSRRSLQTPHRVFPGPMWMKTNWDQTPPGRRRSAKRMHLPSSGAPAT